MKNHLYLLLIPLMIACSEGAEPKLEAELPKPKQNELKLNRVAGEAQGTTYHVSYMDTSGINYKSAFDSILNDFDFALSNWNKASALTKINQEGPRVVFNDQFRYVLEMLEQSATVYQDSKGGFDPTVYPLVSAWGFGLENEIEMTPDRIDSLLALVGFDKLKYGVENSEEQLAFIDKGSQAVKLDFNAIAQGYSVDLIAEFLTEQGIEDYLVEIGGELRCKGLNAQRKAWRVQVDKPIQSKEAVHEQQAVVGLPDGMALATSGNYRKFRERNGVKYSHTIDPRTGYPVKHTLLSATVLASTAAQADAYATMFMVMGLEESKFFLAERKDLELEVYFISSNTNGELETWMSSQMKPILAEAE